MNHKNKRKRRIGLFIIALGIGMLLYPLTSILFNSLMAERRMASFRVQEERLSAEDRARFFAQAEAYNASLDGTADGAVDPFEVKNYATLSPLEFGEDEIFGYLSVPKIAETLPIYLGASEHHLSIGVAQVDGTNLPIGGEGTRSVIAGHRGFTTQAMFRNLGEMEPGDKITITALGQDLEYEVYDTEVIRPSEYQKLAVVKGQDTLTLLTCTPYMINTERLLVNAVRVEEKAIVEETETTAPFTEEGEKPTAAYPEPNAPAQGIMLRRYALMAVVALLWAMLLVVMIKLFRTFQRS